jgi:6,7-dimethyl-8-ribityllumazine synthase
VQRVSLEYGIPIANAVLTTNTDEQAIERAQVKGKEAAQVAVEMANLMESITSLSEDEGAI